MTEDGRAIEIEIEVTGTPEEVWRAIATGPGISSWYVPHIVEEREGGAATASFGDATEMQVAGRVAAWEPPLRIVFDGGEGVEGLAFEWTVEARGSGTCVVRLVNSGFGSGDEWDSQYDAMTDGWGLFLVNLKLHMEHFRGQSGHPMQPMGMWPGTRNEVWADVMRGLGLSPTPLVGDRLVTMGDGVPTLAGTALDVAPTRVAILLDEPTAGTAFIAAEPMGDAIAVSIWSYLYGPDAIEVIERDKPAWQTWLNTHNTNPNPQ